MRCALIIGAYALVLFAEAGSPDSYQPKCRRISSIPSWSSTSSSTCSTTTSYSVPVSLTTTPITTPSTTPSATLSTTSSTTTTTTASDPPPCIYPLLTGLAKGKAGNDYSLYNNYYYDTNGRSVETTPNVPSLQDCVDLCDQEEETCRYFSYYKGTSSDNPYCVLFGNNDGGRPCAGASDNFVGGSREK